MHYALFLSFFLVFTYPYSLQSLCGAAWLFQDAKLDWGVHECGCHRKSIRKRSTSCSSSSPPLLHLSSLHVSLIICLFSSLHLHSSSFLSLLFLLCLSLYLSSPSSSLVLCNPVGAAAVPQLKWGMLGMFTPPSSGGESDERVRKEAPLMYPLQNLLKV